MDIAFAAHRFRIAKPTRYGFDRAGDIAFALRLGGERPDLPKFYGGEHGSGPGAEVLAGEFVARDLEIGIDVGRLYRADLALLIDVLKKLLSGEVLHAPHDGGETRVGELDLVLDAAFSAELEFQLRAAHAYLAVAQGGQAEGLVISCILLVSDPDERGFKEAYHGR